MATHRQMLGLNTLTKSTSAFSGALLMSRLFSHVIDDGRLKPKPREGRPQPPEPLEHKCLIRVVLGNKKISTVVCFTTLDIK